MTDKKELSGNPQIAGKKSSRLVKIDHTSSHDDRVRFNQIWNIIRPSFSDWGDVWMNGKMKGAEDRK